MDINIDSSISKIVLQPTSLCNLDCSYCYLPHKHIEHKMEVNVAQAVAESLIETSNPVTLIWHGGEPMSCGLDYFKKLVQPFVQLQTSGVVNFSIQTNGTLLSQEWCEFLKEYNFQVGVSIDGPVVINSQRVDRKGDFAFNRIMRGIDLLLKNQIKFHALAVVHQDSLHSANDLYSFFSNLGCWSLGINVEEQEGANTCSSVTNFSDVQDFWQELFIAWKENPCIRVREFDFALSWMKSVTMENSLKPSSREIDIFPTIGWNGDVIVLSPELHGTVSSIYNNFIVGNVLEESLFNIIASAKGAKYVIDFMAGVIKCEMNCPYFSFCGGGFASNKFFELGTTNGTQTTNCINSKQRLINAMVQTL